MGRPNILVFMTDHQRADTVLPGSPVIAPNVRRLAQQGVSFSNAYCPSPHCCPSRATFHSGLYPSRHGVWNNVANPQAISHGLKTGVRLWSEDLAAAGYQLAFSGKWHVSAVESPAQRGWRELFSSRTTLRDNQHDWDKYRRLADHGDAHERAEGQILRPGYGAYRLYGNSGDHGNLHDERTIAEAIKAMPQLAASGDPWAMFIGPISPHDPYVVPQKYLDLYDVRDVSLPPSFSDDLLDKPRIYQRLRRQLFGQLTEREVRQAILHFRAHCSYLDDLFGRVLAALDATGEADNTLVLYCSDHGDYCGEHGLFAKGIAAFRGAYHIPSVIRWPAGIRNPGRVIDPMVSLADFAPTFLDLAGVDPARSFTGQSLAPFLRDQTPPAWRDEIHTQCNGIELYYTQRSVMTRDHKYVFNGFDEDELYDLRTDPHECRNLSNDPAYSGIKRQLTQRLWRFAHRENDTAINSYIMVGLAPWGPAEAFAPDPHSMQ